VTDNDLKFWGGSNLTYTSNYPVDCLEMKLTNVVQQNNASEAASIQLSHASKPGPCNWSKVTQADFRVGIHPVSSPRIANTAYPMECGGTKPGIAAEDDEDERLRSIKRRAAEERAEWCKLQPLLEALQVLYYINLQGTSNESYNFH
jgi:hypothetical protein